MRVYLSKDTVSEGKQVEGRGAAALGLFGKPVMGAYIEGLEYSLGKEGFRDCIPSSSFLRGEGVLVLI